MPHGKTSEAHGAPMTLRDLLQCSDEMTAWLEREGCPLDAPAADGVGWLVGHMERGQGPMGRALACGALEPAILREYAWLYDSARGADDLKLALSCLDKLARYGGGREAEERVDEDRLI